LKWMHAVGECGLALTSGVPIMQSFYRAYMRNGKRGNVANAVFMDTGMSRMRGERESRFKHVLPEARLSVFKAWGITPDEQVALEEYYDSWEFTPQVDIENYSSPEIFYVF